MVKREDLELIAKDPRAFLSQCYKTEERIRTKERRIVHLRELSTKITPTLQPVSAYTGPSDKIGDCASQITDLEAEIRSEIKDLLTAQKTVMEGICCLVQDPVQRAILEDRYLAGQRWEEIAYDYHYAYRWVLRLHRRALAAMREHAEEKLHGAL